MIEIEKENVVVIVRVDDYHPQNIKNGLERIFELLNPSFINNNLKEKSILLKPSLLAHTKNTFTNEVVVEQIATILQEKGAKRILIGDSTMTKSITAMAHRKSGMLRVAGKFGHPMINFFEEEYFPIYHTSFKADSIIQIPKVVVDSDIIINIPKMKTHNGYIFTGAIKNFFGLLKDKLDKHRIFKDKTKFQQMLGDIHQAVLSTGHNGQTKPVFHIMDGIIGMEGKGPRSGNLRSFNCLIASFSPAALDAVAFTLMGGNPQDLETIRSLSERNSWPVLFEKLNIIGDDWKDFRQKVKIPSLKNLKSSITTGSFIERISTKLLSKMNPILIIDKKKCIQCMVCASHCPVQAIERDEKISTVFINYKNCIKCFCCGESCAKDAIKVRKPLKRILLYMSLILVLTISIWFIWPLIVDLITLIVNLI